MWFARLLEVRFPAGVAWFSSWSSMVGGCGWACPGCSLNVVDWSRGCDGVRGLSIWACLGSAPSLLRWAGPAWDTDAWVGWGWIFHDEHHEHFRPWRSHFRDRWGGWAASQDGPQIWQTLMAVWSRRVDQFGPPGSRQKSRGTLEILSKFWCFEILRFFVKKFAKIVGLKNTRFFP
jgi:hypothetical protein